MYQEISQLKSISEIESLFKEYSYEDFFNQNEIKSVENKNVNKSLGARYLIKKSIVEYFKNKINYKDFEIYNGENGEPKILVHNDIQTELMKNIRISISHSRNFIATLVVIE